MVRNSTKRQGDTGATVRVWDPATRLFHWLLVALVVVNLYTGLVGGLREMDLHMTSGYAILAAVLFRVVWGFVGSRHSRFADFVRGPAAVLAYVRSLLGGPYRGFRGHNPLGGWSVLAMLASLAVQAGTGLFANDDILTEGPLARHVAKGTSDLLTAVHGVNGNILMALIAVHVAAVLFYVLVKRENLVRAMVTGRKPADPAEAAADASEGGFVAPWRAAVVFAAAAAAAWLLVTA